MFFTKLNPNGGVLFVLMKKIYYDICIKNIIFCQIYNMI